MTIIGIGTDIVEIKRIESVIYRKGDRFAKRIFSPTELMQYHQHNRPIHFFAKRFAVKEAASKALGIGMCKGLAFSQFEVLSNVLGKPILQLSNQAAKLARKLGVKTIHVTLADERAYACAIVIFEC